MISRTCSLETSRLSVDEWHSVPLQPGRDLASVVVEVMTEATTRSLPPAWHGEYTSERARAWIAELDEESATLLIALRESGEPIGLAILFEFLDDDRPAKIDLRLGYVIKESVWGRGFASEMVAGLVGWCRSQPSIRSISGGVAQDNAASASVLIKNGLTALDGPADGEQIYSISLRG